MLQQTGGSELQPLLPMRRHAHAAPDTAAHASPDRHAHAAPDILADSSAVVLDIRADFAK